VEMAVKEFEDIAICLDVRTSSWMFLHLCLLKARILFEFTDAIYNYIESRGLWKLAKLSKRFGRGCKILSAQVNAIHVEVSILGSSPREPLEPEITEIENKLDTCFDEMIKFNFEEDNPDLLFANAAELDEIHSARPKVPITIEDLVEQSAMDNSKSDKSA